MSNQELDATLSQQNTLEHAYTMAQAWCNCLNIGKQFPPGTKMQWQKGPDHVVRVTLRTVPTVLNGKVCVSIEEERCMVNVDELTPLPPPTN